MTWQCVIEYSLGPRPDGTFPSPAELPTGLRKAPASEIASRGVGHNHNCHAMSTNTGKHWSVNG